MVSKEDVIKVLMTCYDPEIPIDMWTLGLIYDLQVRDDESVYIKMTFTTPFCPYGPKLIEDVKKKVAALEGVKDVQVEVVLDPPWKPPEDIKVMFGLGGSRT